MNKFHKNVKIMFIVYIVNVILSVVGYVNNIVNIIQSMPEGPIGEMIMGGLFITQCVGVIIPPLGIVLGLFIW